MPPPTADAATVPRSKRRVTVLLHADPTSADGAASSTPTSLLNPASGDAPKPRTMPPTKPLDMIRVALHALSTRDADGPWMIELLNDAASALLTQATQRSMSALQSSAEVPSEGLDELHSLDSDEFSDPEQMSQPTASNQPRTKIQSFSVGRHIAEVSLSRQAALAWLAAASHCLRAGDSSSLRSAVSFAEQAHDAFPCLRTATMLAWCTCRCAMECDDPTLRMKLEQHALQLLDATHEAHDPTASVVSELGQLHEVRAWCKGMVGDYEGALEAAEAALQLLPRNSELACVAASCRFATGDAEGCRQLLEWTLRVSPNHLVARGLLILWWHGASLCGGGGLEQFDVSRGLVELVAHVKALEAYAVGDEGRGVAGFSNDRSRPVAVVGHEDPSWSQLAAVLKNAAHSYLFVADICCRVQRLDMADAMATSALELITNHMDGGSIVSTLAAKALAAQAAAVITASRFDSGDSGESAARELLDQSAVLKPTQQAALLQAAVSDSAAEGGLWRRYACRRDPTAGAALLAMSEDFVACGDYHRAMDVLFAATEAELTAPLYPIELLVPWMPIL